jgi:serine/threonine-protein kinase HipA
MTGPLCVLLHGAPVGRLWEVGARVAFQIDLGWWDQPDRPTLGQWFEDSAPDEVHFGEPGRLPPFFANLEPEGNLRQWLARRHRVDAGVLELLGAVGHDLPGAVQVVPEDGAVVQARRSVRPAASRVDAFSVAGAQMKLPMSLDKDDRLTLPEPGGLSGWILKIPPKVRYRGLAENEHAMMTWARRAGFDVPVTRLRVAPAFESEEEGDVPRLSLLIQRFDRSDAGTIHQEDLCQVLNLDPDQRFPCGPIYKDRLDSASEAVREKAATMEGVGMVAQRLLGSAGSEEYLRRVVFVVASGNGDAHLKNWAVYYPDRRRARWSPLYDQVCTVAWQDDATLALPLFGARTFASVHQSDLIRLAKGCGLTEARSEAVITDTISALAASWPAAQTEAPLPEHHAARLRAHWRKTVPLLRDGPQLERG